MFSGNLKLAVGPVFFSAKYSNSAATAKSLQSWSDSVRPHRRQPTRLPRPWDSPGKNTGVVAISFSNAWKWKVKVKSLSHVGLLAIPWTAAYQAPPSMGFSRQEYWSGVPLPSPTTAQLYFFHMLARLCWKSFKLGFSSTWTVNFQMYKLDLEKAEEPKIKLPTSIGS